MLLPPNSGVNNGIANGATFFFGSIAKSPRSIADQAQISPWLGLDELGQQWKMEHIGNLMVYINMIGMQCTGKIQFIALHSLALSALWLKSPIGGSRLTLCQGEKMACCWESWFEDNIINTINLKGKYI